jgi:hypothetical protein
VPSIEDDPNARQSKPGSDHAAVIPTFDFGPAARIGGRIAAHRCGVNGRSSSTPGWMIPTSVRLGDPRRRQCCVGVRGRIESTMNGFPTSKMVSR